MRVDGVDSSPQQQPSPTIHHSDPPYLRESSSKAPPPLSITHRARGRRNHSFSTTQSPSDIARPKKATQPRFRRGTQRRVPGTRRCNARARNSASTQLGGTRKYERSGTAGPACRPRRARPQARPYFVMRARACDENDARPGVVRWRCWSALLRCCVRVALRPPVVGRCCRRRA